MSIPLPIDLVRIEKFCELTGYTPSAVRGKIASGEWREGAQYRKAPDGHILVSLEGYHAWAEGQGSESGEMPSKSASTGSAADSRPRLKWSPRKPILSTPSA